MLHNLATFLIIVVLGFENGAPLKIRGVEIYDKVDFGVIGVDFVEFLNRPEEYQGVNFLEKHHQSASD